MNRIAFDLRLVKGAPDEPDARDYLALDIRVDDRDFLDYVREVEGPFAAAEGHPNLAGKYESLPAEMALSNLAGEQADKVSLYDCECGCFGCWPLLVRILKSENKIFWSDFAQPHRGPKSRASWWRYDKLGPFEFDREQYVAALAQAESELRSWLRTKRCT
jgi:hypothetical protein